MTLVLSVSMATTMSEDAIDETGSTSAIPGVTSVDISPTEADNISQSSQPETLTKGDPSQQPIQLYSSFTDDLSDTSQFPMQQATQLLPTDQFPLETTDSKSITLLQLSLDSLTVTDSGVNTTSVLQTIGALDVINSSTDITTSVTASSGTDSSGDISRDYVTTDSLYPADLENDPNSATQSILQSSLETLISTSSTFAQNLPASDTSLSLSKLSSSSSQFEATSRDLYSTHTPAETTFMSVPIGVDTVSMQSSSVPPIPDVTSRPVSPSAKGQSTILPGR